MPPTSKVSKVERLLNLVICLLSTRQFVTADYIRRSVVGYTADDQSVDAFNRMFERDKTELRELGIPLVTGPSSMGQGLDGYRINRDSYELPDISFERDEAAAIAMAATLWDTPEISAISQTAVLKLRAAGFDVRAEDEIGISPSTSAKSMGSEATLGALLSAIENEETVTFTYRAGSGSAGVTRTLEPWGVVTYRGRWYVVGHDRDRDDTRTFRLSRATEVTAIGDAVGSRVPEGAELQQIVATAVDSAAGSDGRTARVWVAAGRAAGLRRHARSSTPATHGSDAGDLLDIDIRSLTTLARMVLGAGADAVVYSPPELREVVVAALDAVVGEVG